VKFTLAKIRKAARELLTLDEKDTRRLFEGELACDTIPKIVLIYRIQLPLKLATSIW